MANQPLPPPEVADSRRRRRTWPHSLATFTGRSGSKLNHKACSPSSSIRRPPLLTLRPSTTFHPSHPPSSPSHPGTRPCSRRPSHPRRRAHTSTYPPPLASDLQTFNPIQHTHYKSPYYQHQQQQRRHYQRRHYQHPHYKCPHYHNQQSTQCQCDNEMEDKDTDVFPIIADGRTVARAIIKHDRKQAIESANVAASHVSTPDDIQICTFSDGSHSNDTQNWGGVALAYRHKWLPQGWAAGDEATYPSGDREMDENAWPFVHTDMVAKAWPFGHAVGAPAMEGVGVVESLYAANEELERHLPVLIKHASTVLVKATTDCQEILKYISKATLAASQAKKLPPVLVKQMHELILALHGHGIPVVVELHWCPRNKVPQLLAADALAGEAMRTGLGYCTVTQNFWSEAIQSVTMKQLEPMLSGAVRFARVPVDKENKPRRGKKAGEKRKAEEELEESGRSKKKSKLSKAGPRIQPRKPPRPTMPAAWRLDAETTTIFISDPRGIHSATPIRPAPYVRMVALSTKETREKNVFINDGVNVFSLIEPVKT